MKALGILTLFVIYGVSHPQQKEELLEEIVAVVGDEVILKSELEEVYLLYTRNIPQSPQEESQVKKELLDELIKEKLLLIKAKEDTSITVEEEEVEELLENQLQNLEAQVGKDNFEAQLKKEGYTRETFKERYRERVREQLYVNKLVDKKIKPLIIVTPEEVRKFYEEKQDSIPVNPELVRLSQIFFMVKASEEKENEAKERANVLYDKLKEGADFLELAQRYSDDRETAPLGGDLGYLRRIDLPQEISDRVFILEPGEISEPLRGDFGYHIFRCDAKESDVIRLRHIFISIKPSRGDTLKTKELAENVMNKLESGEKFEDLAREYSDDTQSKDLGGDLGWLPLTELPKEIQDTLKKMKTGEIKGPIFFGLGYHIMRLDERKKGGKPTFDEIREQLSQIIYQRKLNEKIDDYLKDIRKKVYVEIKL